MGELNREYRTQRLLLRPYTSADVRAVFAYASQPSYSEFLNLPRPYERKHAEERIAVCLKDDWTKEPSWALVLDGRVVGTVAVRITRAPRPRLLALAGTFDFDHVGAKVTEQHRTIWPGQGFGEIYDAQVFKRGHGRSTAW